MEVNRREALIAVGAMAVGVASRGTAAFPRATDFTSDQMSPLERLLLIDLRAQGVSYASVFIAARPDMYASVLNRVIAAGGTVLHDFAEVQGLYASVPIVQLRDLRLWPEIERIQVTGSYAFDVMGTSAGQATSGSLARRLSSLGPSNPLSGQETTQAVLLRTANPTYDGRGVTIGEIEELHPHLPSLLRGFDLSGRQVPKLVDYVLDFPTSTSIHAPAPSPADPPHIIWRRVQPLDADTSGTASFGGRAYRLPRSATQRDLAIVRNEDSRATFAVTALWDMAEQKVWLLANEDTDFGIVTPIDVSNDVTRRTEVRVRDVAAGNEDRRWVVLRAYRERRIIGLQLYFTNHADETLSIAAGHNFFGSLAGGVAPGAAILAHVPQRRELGALDLPYIQAAMASISDHRSDLVTLSTSINELGYGADQSVTGLLIERAVRRSGIPVFSGAGNGGPMLNIIEAVTGSDAVIAIGGYVPNGPRRAIYGVESTEPDCLAPYSSWGPREDGGLKPELVAPTEVMCGDVTATDLATSQLRIGGGTSCAAPGAAGLAALLISAAKQVNIPFDLARLKIALFSSARFMRNIEARAQGHGLIQVADAWEILKGLGDYDVPHFRTVAPVRTYRSSWFKTPNLGSGLFEHIGWTPESRGERNITIIRTAGPVGPQEYILRWKGDTSSFHSPVQRVQLGLNEALSIPISIRVAQSKAYSAILDFIDPTKGIIVHSVLCTVFVADSLSAENGYQVRLQRTLPRPGNSVIFVDVPPEASQLRIQVEQRGASLRFIAQMPSGPLAVSGIAGSAVPFEREAPTTEPTRQNFQRTFINPEPGVWQIWLQDAAEHPRLPDAQIPSTHSAHLDPAALALTVSAYGVSATSASANERNASLRAHFANRLRSVPSAQIRSLGLGSEATDRLFLRQDRPAIFKVVEIPPGTTELEAEIIASTSEATQLGLAILRVSPTHQPWPTGAYSAMMACNIGAGSRKRVQLRNPPPGLYKIAIDPIRIPDGGLSVDYRDAFFHPMFGSFDVDDVPSDFATATAREATGTTNVQRHASHGRRLVARMGVFSDEIMNVRFEPETACPPIYGASCRSATPAYPNDPNAPAGVIIEHQPLATITLPVA